jgi:hypothetical protein
MAESLASSTASPVIVGGNAEAARKYYILTPKDAPGVRIGVVSSGLGSRPAIVLLPQHDSLVIGHDRSLTVLDGVDLRLRSTVRLDGVFFVFVRPMPDAVVCIHELGVLRVNYRGDVDWHVDSDVIREHRLLAVNVLMISTLDGQTTYIDLDVGGESTRPPLDIAE